MPSFSRLIPFSSSTTPLHGATYLLGVSLFSISFLVFLNSSVSFVVTDLLGQKKGVGDVVGTLGFADELVAIVACPAWGLLSDRLGVRWVSVIGYTIIGVSLMVLVQAKNVYPQLLLARMFFSLGGSAAATMVTASLPSLTDDSDDADPSNDSRAKRTRDPRHSVAHSVSSELTITPERYTRTMSNEDLREAGATYCSPDRAPKTSVLAGYVGLFTGCGALVALLIFLPLPTTFGNIENVTPADAVSYSFYVVGVASLLVAIFVFLGFRNLKGEEGKGWKALWVGRRDYDEIDELNGESGVRRQSEKVIPYLHLFKDSVFLGFKDRRIGLGYVGGFVARASTVAISTFIPLYVNTYFIGNGYCHGSPHDPNRQLKEECRAAYILSSILTGSAQMCALILAPVFGYISHKPRRVNWLILICTVFGIAGYVILPQLASPEFKNVDGRGGSPVIFLVTALIGISQIGAIVCSLGTLGQGVLAVELPRTARREPSIAPDEDESAEGVPLLRIRTQEESIARIRLKGSIAGVYSLGGGIAILLLAKVGGYLFDNLSTGAPFYMMASFNAILLVVSLGMDASRFFARNTEHE